RSSNGLCGARSPPRAQRRIDAIRSSHSSRSSTEAESYGRSVGRYRGHQHPGAPSDTWLQAAVRPNTRAERATATPARATLITTPDTTPGSAGQPLNKDRVAETMWLSGLSAASRRSQAGARLKGMRTPEKGGGER